jgi:hypothetical protein|nr:MAG TPA: hypothetical protein [Caudoviricetes sp.]
MIQQNELTTHALLQIISNLKKSGIEDITTEVVGLHDGSRHLKFRFYTEEQWVSNQDNIANEATRLFGKTYKDKYKMPNHVVKYENETYCVTIV